MNNPLTIADIDDLIARGEDSKTERKQEIHYSRSRGEEAEFIKDLLSLVNASGEGSSFLLIGMEDRTDTPHDITALNLREPNLQQFIRERIEPTLRFSYREYVYGGVKIGIIEIPRSRTRFHLASKSIIDESGKTVLERGHIYVRDGTTKRVVNASDFTLFRNEIEDRTRAEAERLLEQDRPDPEVCFSNGTNHCKVRGLWDQSKWPTFDPPAEIRKSVDLALIVKNVGKAMAKNARVILELPDDCFIDMQYQAQPGYGPRYFRAGAAYTIETIYQDGRDMGLPFPSVVVPDLDKSYFLSWRIICEGMTAEKQGTLEFEALQVLPRPGSS